MWNLISVRLETVLVLVQGRCRVCANVPSALKSFWTHRMVLLGDKAQVEGRYGPIGGSANLNAR